MVSIKARWAAALLAPLLGWAGQVRAHHIFSAEYDIDKPVSLRGTITRVEWINPHGWIYIDVPDPDGRITKWAIEFGGPNALLRRGVRKSDFPVGSVVLVKGYRAKNGRAVANATTVKLADGRHFFTGSEGGPDSPGGSQ